MAPPRCSHPCAPRSTSSVYCLLTIPLLRLGLLDPLTDSTSIASIQDHSNAVHGPLQPGFCREQHDLSAHSSCSAHSACALHPGVADCRRPIGPPTCQEKIRTETKSGPTEHHQQREFCNKDEKRHVRRWRHDREKPFGCDKNMLETENGADSCPNHGGVITLP